MLERRQRGRGATRTAWKRTKTAAHQNGPIGRARATAQQNKQTLLTR